MFAVGFVAELQFHVIEPPVGTVEPVAVPANEAPDALGAMTKVPAPGIFAV